MDAKIFKRYDIRGVIGRDWEVKDAYQIGLAMVQFLKKHNPNLQQILVGQDSRDSSPQIFEHLSQSLCDAGLDVAAVGVCPTPVISAFVKATPGSAGVMITASHNPLSYNGLKIYLHELGGQVWGENIEAIRALYAAGRVQSFQIGKKRGQISLDLVAKQKYLSILQQEFATLKACNIAMGIDCLGGAATLYVEELVGLLNLTNVWFVNACERKITQPDPTLEENLAQLKKLVREKKLDLGVAFDGDADRFIAVDGDGNLVSGDQLNAIFCKALLRTNPGAKVVVDIKTSAIVSEVVAALGGTCFISPTGNPLVQKKAAEQDAIFCGEASCHFTFFDSGVKVDDGIYAWLRLVQQLKLNPQNIAQLVLKLPQKSLSPEIVLGCSSEAVARLCIEKVTSRMLTCGATLSTLDGLKAHLPQGWGLIRKSNTQPLLSLRFEANNRDDLAMIKKHFAVALADLIDKKELECLVE